VRPWALLPSSKGTHRRTTGCAAMQRGLHWHGAAVSVTATHGGVVDRLRSPPPQRSCTAGIVEDTWGPEVPDELSEVLRFFQQDKKQLPCTRGAGATMRWGCCMGALLLESLHKDKGSKIRQRLEGPSQFLSKKDFCPKDCDVLDYPKPNLHSVCLLRSDSVFKKRGGSTSPVF
jgi:hypothetical protein